MPETPRYQFPYPADGDLADGPAAFQGLAEAVEDTFVAVSPTFASAPITGGTAATGQWAESTALSLVPVTEYGMGGYLVLVTGSLQLSTAGGTASIQLVAGNATGGGLSDAIRQVVAFPAMASAPVVPFSAFMFIGVNAVTGNNLIAKLRYGNGTGPVTLFGNSTVISLVRLTGG